MEEKKMKLRTSILAAAAVMLSLTSCLKDQADIFEEPSSQRMQNYLENVRKVLQEPENGWILSYCPGASYATCYMGVQFGAQQVTAYGQDAPETPVTSGYKLTTDDGPVLSFDTYNSVLHYYATSDASHYQARGGDFEFNILDVTDNFIILTGKRSGNFCYLLKASTPVSEFLVDALEAEEKLNIVSFAGEVTGGLVEGFLDAASHTLSIGRKGAETIEMVNARYMVVPTGQEGSAAIQLFVPFTFQGVTFTDFVYTEDPEDSKKGTFTGSGITFQKVVPAGFVPYEDFVGKWELNWYNGSFPVELVALEEGISFKMKGLSTYFEPVLGYNGSRGFLTWEYQAIGSAGANTIVLAPWDGEAGYLTWREGVGMEGHAEDNSVEKLVVNFTDNGAWETYNCDSWLIWSVTSGGSSAGAYESWTFTSGSYQLPGPLSLVKIVE